VVKLKVPRYRQKGNNCWWFCVKMVKAFKKGAHAALPEKQERLEKKAPPKGLSQAMRQIEMLGQGFSAVPEEDLGPNNYSSEALAKVLTKHGAIVHFGEWAKFGFPSNHVVVITGVEEDSVWFVDPSDGTEQQGWPIDVIWGLSGFLGGSVKYNPEYPVFWVIP
jgi:Papain-like cysteine protease AvrRpt2